MKLASCPVLAVLLPACSQQLYHDVHVEIPVDVQAWAADADGSTVVLVALYTDDGNEGLRDELTTLDVATEQPVVLDEPLGYEFTFADDTVSEASRFVAFLDVAGSEAWAPATDAPRSEELAVAGGPDPDHVVDVDLVIELP
jgi:hypothetical protein